MIWDVLRGIALSEAGILIAMLIFLHRGQIKRPYLRISLGLLIVGEAGWIISTFGDSQPTWNSAPLAVVAFTLAILALRENIFDEYESTQRHLIPPSVLTIFAVIFVGIVVLAYQSGDYAADSCNTNNRQDKDLAELIETSIQTSDPNDPRANTPQARKALAVFKKKLVELRDAEKCPTAGF